MGKITLVDSEDITDGNLKMILGLIWHLILHFQIMEQNESNQSKKKETPKESILNWLKEYQIALKCPVSPISY